MLEVQVQGRFKSAPVGDVYLGAEITERMHLGLVVRGLARVLLNFMRKKLPGMHYSFGDRQDAQLPHIVMPLWGTADQMVVTPPGESPPPLGWRLEEPPPHRIARLAKGSRHAWMGAKRGTTKRKCRRRGGVGRTAPRSPWSFQRLRARKAGQARQRARLSFLA